MKTTWLPQETVANRQKTREAVKQLQKDLHDMQKLYEKEMGKKKVLESFMLLGFSASFLSNKPSRSTHQRSFKRNET
jgi:hypothetical protein